MLEFGQFIAGPYAATLLGDFGAEVIKIEPPTGDTARHWGRIHHNGHPMWWSLLARNKRSIAVNLRDPDGQAIAADLCATADVIIENFRPGTMERWGLGPDDVHARNENVIYARISGYGQTGRYRDRPGFAAAGEAMSGLRYINGYPGQAPPRSGISLGDSLAGLSAFQGIMLALYARDVQGARGQVVDASIVDACFALLESAVLEYEKGGFVREPTGTSMPRIAPSNIYRSRDGKWLVIAANHDTLWRRMADVMGAPALADDERFNSHAARGEHEAELDALIGAWAAERTAEEIDRVLEEAGVVCAPVYSAADIHADPYFRERGLLVEVDDEVHGAVSMTGVVPKLSATPGAIREPARWTIGADTDDVLRALGVGETRLAELRERGVVW